MWRVLALLLSVSAAAYAEDLRVDYTRESLTGTHIHYQQYIDGIPVIGGERVETISHDGSRTFFERLAKPSTSRIAALSTHVPLAGDLVYLNISGEAKL